MTNRPKVADFPREAATLVRACHLLQFAGCQEMFDGHISWRIPGHELMLIQGHGHPFGIGLGDMTADDIIMMDLDNNVVEGKHEPMDEVGIHGPIYRARPEISSVCNGHPFYAMAFATAGKEILPVYHWGLLIPDGVRVMEMPDVVVRGRGAEGAQHGNIIVEGLGDRNAVLLRKHALITCGRTIQEATVAQILIEKCAKQQLLGEMLGGAKPLPKGMVERFRGIKAESDIIPGTWKFYERRLLEYQALLRHAGAPERYAWE